MGKTYKDQARVRGEERPEHQPHPAPVNKPKFELEPEEQDHLHNLLAWQEYSRTSRVQLG